MKAAASRIQQGFTLIELLVVVAVIALLIGILLPALGSARASSYTAVSSGLQRNLLTGLSAYTASNDGWIPGVNSSGRDIWDNANDQAMLDRLDRDGGAPVQAWDWMTPCLDGDTLPVDREARFAYLYDELADPAQSETTVSWDDANGLGIAEMETYLLQQNQGALTAMSFVMPNSFQYYGAIRIPGGGSGPVPPGFIRLANGIGFDSTAATQIARPPANYIPRISNIEGASRKIMNASGTRYIDADTGIISTDFSLRGGIYQGSAFQDYGAIHLNSPAYGFERSGGLAEPITYRHKGRLVATFYDGSTTTITRQESYDPAYWFPRGSILGSGDIVQEAENYVDPDTRIIN